MPTESEKSIYFALLSVLSTLKFSLKNFVGVFSFD